MSRELARREAVDVQTWTREKIDTIKNTLGRDLSDPELAWFFNVCQQTGLDPQRREIYAIKQGGKVRFDISIDGHRKLAQRTGKFRGMLPIEWCGPEGDWRDVWLKPEPPHACRVRVLHADMDEPVSAVLLWSEYSKTGGPIAKQMPAHMLAKATEMLAFRRAFPDHYAGIYGAAETGSEPPAQPELLDEQQVDLLMQMTSWGGLSVNRFKFTTMPAKHWEKAVLKAAKKIGEHHGLPDQAVYEAASDVIHQRNATAMAELVMDDAPAEYEVDENGEVIQLDFAPPTTAGE